jgi:hypothetical protein
MEYMARMNDPNLQPLWKRGFSNESGRLFQGIHDIPRTNTCFFVELTSIIKYRNITYGKIVCYSKPHEKEKESVRLTVGGDILDYSGDVATSTADITTFKIWINSTLSTKDAAMMMMDIKILFGHTFTAVWIHENIVITLPRRDSGEIKP